MADLYRLEPRQYLNDVLMDVAISKIKASMTKKVSDRVHIFNTYFFFNHKSGRQHEVVQFLKRQCDRSGMNLLRKNFCLFQSVNIRTGA